MNKNTINVVEATPPIVNALKILKQRTPTINENSSTKPFGSNGAIQFPPNTDAESKITGPFDVQLTYLEEDDGQGGTEMVPYIQILDSSVQNAAYAGYVYYLNTINSILPGVLAPSAGWLYLEIDLANNTATYNIASTVPTYSLQWKTWAYALAYISVSGNVYSIRRVHLPGNIVMPCLEEYDLGSDIFKAKINYSTSKIDVSGGTAVNGASTITCNSESFGFPAINSSYYIVLTITYANGSYSASLSTSSSIAWPTAMSATYTISIARVVNTDGAMSIEYMRHPGPVYVIGRWG